MKRRRRKQRKWTSDEVLRLCDWWAEGLTIARIASRLHRSRASVAGAIERNRLGECGGARAIPCLTCGRLFQPKHKFNKICASCKGTEDWQSGNDWHVQW